MAQLSPMMQHYMQIKEENKNSIIFYRLGDFYEMFFDDAITASKELELELTGRDCGLEERAPMCGVPHHTCDAYIQKLVSKGYKVAICEQVEDPAAAKGLVKREIVRVVSPGTVTDGNMLDETKNNYLCSVCILDGVAGVCFADASTGDSFVTELSGEGVIDRVVSEIGRFLPSEVLLNAAAYESKQLISFLKNRINCVYECRNDDEFSSEFTDRYVSQHCPDNHAVFNGRSVLKSSFGCLAVYLCDSLKNEDSNINNISYYSDAQYMHLDISARTNLELTKNIKNRDKKGSLLWVLDETSSAMGKRLIKNWIEQPLLNPVEIIKRHNAVEELFNASSLRAELSDSLSKIYDIERIMTKIVYSSVNPREVKSLGFALMKFPKIKSLISSCSSKLISEVFNSIGDFSELAELINNAIIDNPPVIMKDGGYINEGFNEELDVLRSDMNGASDLLKEIERREKERTNIRTLKVGYNRVFGYYIEVSNSFKEMVPDDYIRKQTLTNGERYITEELKQIEARVLGAKERSIALEHTLFESLKSRIIEQQFEILNSARAIARLDVINSFATVAKKNNYVCPKLSNSGKINIINGRHPVVEKMIDSPFVPNDTVLDKNKNRCLIITGPNMAGKSTYMRQTALIVIMAQIGSFIPASSADIDLVDAIFTRIGASDDLAGGQSTFMVEMTEIANILKYATSDSLLILDEIGRGTSTYDGMSIARAVLEFVCDKKKLGAKTLFATHYHELTELESKLDGVVNYNIAVKKRGFDITFLRKIIKGGADESYGIEVAKLAGIPEVVIKRAKHILDSIDNKKINMSEVSDVTEIEEPDMQITFGNNAEKEIINMIRDIEVTTLTPIEALNILYDLNNKSKNI